MSPRFTQLSALVFGIGLLYSAEAANADQIKFLADPEQALSAYALAIDSANTSIDLATFIFEPCDASGRIVIEKLVRKAKAGVKVRVLLDAFQQKEDQKQNIADQFAATGIAVKFFSNTLIDIDTRLHEKFMVVDRTAYIAGGRNISDPYFALSSIYNYVDRDVLVKGASAAGAAAAFNEVWNSTMSDAIDSEASDFEPWNEFCANQPQPSDERLMQVRQYLETHAKTVLASAPTRSCSQVAFRGDGPDFADEAYGQTWQNGASAPTFLTAARLIRKRSTDAVIKFLAGARRKVTMENWAYMPIHDLARAFARLRANKIATLVLSNYDMEEEGPTFFREAKEVAIATATTRDNTGSEQVKLVAAAGTAGHAYSLTPERTRFFLHGKVATRDDQDGFVGSFNMDSRSAHINLESVVTFTNCPTLVSDIASRVDEVRRAYEFDQASGHLPVRAPPSFLAKILAEVFISEF